MIYIFKTSVKFKKQIKEIAIRLDTLTEIKKWNFDLEDCDKILRIESTKNICLKIISVLNNQNIDCVELF